MTGLRATAIEELCQTLGLRTPIGLLAPGVSTVTSDIYSDSGNATGERDVARFTDEQLTALGVLAQPEAIAVVTRDAVIHILATRGPWLAEHVIDGQAHHLHAADSDNAAILLLDRCGIADHGASPPRSPINVTLAAYHRATELVRANDDRRACAALVAEGAPPLAATRLVEALHRGITEVAGLSSDGRRFVGCDLAYTGDARTGRWLVPPTIHANATGVASHHPSLHGVRVLLEPVASRDLVDELCLIFGDA